MLNRMRCIIEEIRQADIAYYKHDRPIMPDREYDQLYDELLELEKKTGIVLSGSPTNKVSGEILEELVSVSHSKPMLSAKKTKSIDEAVRFAADQSVIVSWKLDGLTLVLRYEDGKLMQAITRGSEGLIGEDVTHTVRVMMNVPLEIPYTDPFEVRGEGVVSWSNFEKINMDIDIDDEPYSHPRNLASGSVRRLDAGKSRRQFLEFIAFDLVSDNGSYPTKGDQLKMLADNGFDVVEHVIIPKDAGEQSLREAISSFDPQKCQFPVDGLIVEYDDTAYGQSLGSTGHHENRILALKWEDALYETEFLGLELATTRTGMVSITGMFEDVEIDGAVINRAYLHNLDILDSFSLGMGDTVKLYKANQIIPQLAENVTRSGTYKIPMQCPCCGESLQIRKSRNGTRFLYCDNPICSAKWVQKLVHFCHKTRMNIEGISEKTIEKLINAGMLKNFGDLYCLHKWRVTIARLPGFGPTLVQNLLDSIDKSRNCTLNQFIAGLGIPMVGRSAARILNTCFDGDWALFEKAIQDGFDFTQLQDFGQVMHDNIYAWYADEEAAKLWRSVLEHITFMKPKAVKKEYTNPFQGKIVVATGKLENYTRDGIQEKLLGLGADPKSSVSKKTDYLIVGEGAGGKLSKAQELGVTVLTEEQFEAMLAIPRQ